MKCTVLEPRGKYCAGYSGKYVGNVGMGNAIWYPPDNQLMAMNLGFYGFPWILMSLYMNQQPSAEEKSQERW